MNTHILILLSDIESKIKEYKEDIEISEINGDYLRAAAFTDKIAGLKESISLGKQISLDEESIKEKAKIFGNLNYAKRAPYLEQNLVAKSSYKQALKDLL